MVIFYLKRRKNFRNPKKQNGAKIDETDY